MKKFRHLALILAVLILFVGCTTASRPTFTRAYNNADPDQTGGVVKLNVPYIYQVKSIDGIDYHNNPYGVIEFLPGEHNLVVGIKFYELQRKYESTSDQKVSFCAENGKEYDLRTKIHMPAISKEEKSGITYLYTKSYYFKDSLFGVELISAQAIDVGGNDITELVQGLATVYSTEALRWIPEIHEIVAVKSE